MVCNPLALMGRGQEVTLFFLEGCFITHTIGDQTANLVLELTAPCSVVLNRLSYDKVALCLLLLCFALLVCTRMLVCCFTENPRMLVFS